MGELERTQAVLGKTHKHANTERPLALEGAGKHYLCGCIFCFIVFRLCQLTYTTDILYFKTWSKDEDKNS